MYLLKAANIMFLSFIRYELFSFEHGNPISHKMYNIILLLFVRIQSSFFQPEVLQFLPIYFPHIVSISGKPYLFSWERLDSKKFILCMCILRTEKQDGRTQGQHYGQHKGHADQRHSFKLSSGWLHFVNWTISSWLRKPQSFITL